MIRNIKTKNKKVKEIIFLLIIFGIILNLSLIFAATSFTGGTGGFGTSAVSTTSSSASSSGISSSTGGTFYGGSYSSFGGAYGSTSSFGGAVYGASYNPQFTNPSFFSGAGFVSPDVYWPKFNTADCLERQDFIMQIAPGGCSPSVVRSDLLEEQNVPVFCKIMSIQVNPLIDVSRIRSIYFRGNYPKGISGISYFPARAAVRSYTSLISSPVNDNLGYVVIILSRQKKEADMPEFIGGNLTATVDYDAEGMFGSGNTNFYVSEINDEEWYRNYKQYGFWNGKGYIRADSIEPDKVTLSVYRDIDSKQSTFTLAKGETSRDIYLSGFYCAAGMNVRLENIGAPVNSALLQINGQQMWVAQGDRIMDRKCTVSNLNVYAGGGKITINCPVKNGRIELSLNSGKAKLSYNGVEYNESFVGDKIGEKSYLGYVGEDFRGNKFAVVVEDEYSENIYEFNDKEVYSVVEDVLNKNKREITSKELQDGIVRAIKNEYRIKLAGIGKSVEDKIKVVIVLQSESDSGFNLKEVTTAKDRIWDLTKEEEKNAKEYYDYAVKYYEDVASLYPNEKMLLGTQEESYAAEGLYEAAKLSREFGMNEKANEFYDRILREYPNSGIANQVLRERDLFLKYDGSNSRAMVNVNGEPYSVDLLDFKRPAREEVNADLLINGKQESIGLGEVRSIYDKNDVQRTIQLKEINDEYIVLSYSRSGSNFRNYYGITNTSSSSGYKTEKIVLGGQTDFDGIRVKLMNINLKKQAKISITPKAYGPRAESNFTFRVGIEKRAIKLSPEKTKDLIENLKNNIKQWSDINDKLGNVIKGMKTACFATSATLTVKNLLSGWTGESMARKELMTKAGGWNEFCEKEVNGGKYPSIAKCLLDNNGVINKDIEIYKSKIEETNEIMKQIQSGLKIERSDILDLNGQVDAKKVENAFKEKFDEFCRSKTGEEVTLPDKDSTKVSFGAGGVCNWDTLTHEQRKEIMTLLSTREAIAGSGGSSVLNDSISRDLGRVTLDAKNYWEYTGALKKQEEESKQYNLGIRTIVPEGDKITYGDIKTITKGDASNSVYRNYNVGDNVVRLFIPFKESFAGATFNANSEVAGKEVIVSVTRQAGGDYVLNPNASVYLVNGQGLSQAGVSSVKEYMGFKGLTRFRESNAKAYQNKMLKSETLYVKYFERAPYKGLPAEVPFDVDNGWYVEMTYVLSGVGKPYDDSGRVLNFWICNVGANGLIEFKKSADDICRFYNGNADADLNFPGMSQSESRGLLARAQQAIYDAAKQYSTAGKTGGNIIIGKNTFKSGIALGGEEGRCSDFMSPADCNIMFNVCDPVICPASRCDLGGDFRVDDVIQTGVIGSLMLCLPNAKEGILVPICLSGVHAGIEGYLSILNSSVACLNESLTTGKNIGICDEIKSIYLCEFFWKQATPLINVIIPRIVESFYSQGVRGGGEYLTVQNAWDNLKASIDYFRNQYAVNSMQAFQARSTEEIGGEICKSFTSLSYPDTSSLFDKLIEPDSPVQYSAWFSESILTSATLPSTSQYKVYYHIYAGKDQGAYYIVYLKELPVSNYIYSSQMYIVETGYIAKGSQVDRAKDFTAVSGYKQLCININGKDECGFGTVTSSYFLNSITDAYAAEQVKTGIKSSSECVAGTPSLLSMVQPNLQAGAEEVLNPQLYNSGIIRVCATENPGKKVLPNGQYDTTNSTFDRWKDVGYCDDPTIRCWLDTSSVKNVIKDKGILNETLKNVDLNVLGQIDYWSEDQSVSIAVEAEKAIESLTIGSGESKSQIDNKISSIVKELTDLSNLGASNKYRARALYLLGKLYGKIAKSFLETGRITITQAVSSISSVTGTSDAWDNFLRQEGNNYYLLVYNSSTDKEEEIQIQSLDKQSGTVILMDGTVKEAIIEGTEPSRWILLTEGIGGSTWTDDMLRDGVNIYVQGWYLGKGDTVYKYVSRGWLTADNDFYNMKLGYVDGIKELVSKTSIFGGKLVVDGKDVNRGLSSNEQMAEKVFEILKK